MPNFNPLSPGSSPQVARGSGIRRLNRLPIYLGCGVTFAFLAGICWVAASRGSRQEKPKENDHGGSAIQYAKDLAGDRLGGTVTRAHAPEPAPAAAPAVAILPSQAASTPVASPTPNELEKQRLVAFQEALHAKSGVENTGLDRIVQQRQQLDAQRVTEVQKADPNNAADALEDYRHALAEARGMIGPQNDTNPPEKNPNDLENFKGPRTRWDLASRREFPRTPYVLQTGSIIPAVAISAMDSDLPGSVIAQVSQNVYDSPSGRFLLIPQGAKLFGGYVAKPEYGQSRIFVAWQRILFPDGSTFDLGAMEGADEQGQAGFHDQTNNHYLRTFGSALAMSLVTGGIGLTQGGQSSAYGAPNFGSEMSQALGQNLGSVVGDMTRRNLNIPPTLRIRAGYRFNVAVSKDMTFQSAYRVPAY